MEADAPVSRLVRDRWAAASAALGPEQDHSKAALAWFQELEDM